MSEVTFIAIAGAVFVLALVVAWKITWFLLKVVFWMIAIGVLAGTVWWYVQRSSPPHAHQQVYSQPVPDQFTGPLPRVMPRMI